MTSTSKPLEFTFSAGPWTVEYGDKIVDKSGSLVAFIAPAFYKNGQLDLSAVIANSRLISAAPEMLEALELAEIELASEMIQRPAALRVVRDAIARARRGAP